MKNLYLGIKDDLAYFLAMESARSLQEVAKKIGVSQSALTRALDRLERNLGFRVVMRMKQGIRFTAEGKEFYQDLKQWSNEWNRIHQKYLSKLDMVSGEYVIGCHQSIAIDFLSPMINELITKFPELKIKIQLDSSINIVESINHFQTDFGLVVNPASLPELVIKKIQDVKIGLYYLESDEDSNNAKQSTIFYNPQMQNAEKCIRFVRDHIPGVKHVIAVADYEVIANFVKCGAGYGFLPNHVANRLALKQNPLFKEETYLKNYHLCLVYRNELKRSAGVEFLVQFIQKHTKKYYS